MLDNLAKESIPFLARAQMQRQRQKKSTCLLGRRLVYLAEDLFIWQKKVYIPASEDGNGETVREQQWYLRNVR